jgi:hypothetical protein
MIFVTELYSPDKLPEEEVCLIFTQAQTATRHHVAA